MADALQEETADVLAQLIRFNTVNPPGDERACQEWLRDYLTEAGLECELDGTEPERPNLVAHARRRASRAGARLPLARRHRARRRRGLDARPVVGRGPRRLPVGPRRAGHEVPDRRRGGRRRAAGPRRLAPGPRRAEGLLGRRRGDRRHQGRQVAVREPARPRPRRLPAQRGRRHRDAVRRPPPARRLLRGEGHVPLRRARARTGRPRVRARDRRQRAAQARRPRSSGSARAAPPTTSPTSRARSCARSATTPTTRRAPSSASARSTRGWPRCSSRRSASPLAPDDHLAPARRST